MSSHNTDPVKQTTQGPVGDAQVTAQNWDGRKLTGPEWEQLQELLTVARLNGDMNQVMSHHYLRAKSNGALNADSYPLTQGHLDRAAKAVDAEGAGPKAVGRGSGSGQKGKPKVAPKPDPIAVEAAKNGPPVTPPGLWVPDPGNVGGSFRSRCLFHLCHHCR